MAKPKLAYFNFNGGRGEDCRLALHAAGVDFEDDRVDPPTWGARKPTTPYGALPTFERDGKTLGQSNAILTLIGRENGMHPTDLWEAGRHEAILNAVEGLRSTVEKVMTVKDPEKKKAAREEMAAGPLQSWGGYFEAQLGDGPFLGGDKLFVADLKLWVVMKWFRTGGIDHVEKTVFDGFSKLTAHYNAVSNHPAVKSWYAAR